MENQTIHGTGDATNLRARRRSLNLTQQAVADAVGVDRAALSRIERGVEVPRHSVRLRLAHALGIDARVLTEKPS